MYAGSAAGPTPARLVGAAWKSPFVSPQEVHLVHLTHRRPPHRPARRILRNRVRGSAAGDPSPARTRQRHPHPLAARLGAAARILRGTTTLTRGTGPRTAWLSPAISAAGAVLVSVHLINVGIEYTANHLSKASPAHEPLHQVGGALFTLGMLPFGVAIIASAAVGLVARTLPRWLTWIGLVVGLTAVVNGTMLGTESAWGFLLGTLWVLAGGITLQRKAPRPQRRPNWPPPPPDLPPAGTAVPSRTGVGQEVHRQS